MEFLEFLLFQLKVFEFTNGNFASQLNWKLAHKKTPMEK